MRMKNCLFYGRQYSFVIKSRERMSGLQDEAKSVLHRGVLVVIYFLFEKICRKSAYAVLCEDWRILASDIAMLSDLLA